MTQEQWERFDKKVKAIIYILLSLAIIQAAKLAVIAFTAKKLLRVIGFDV